MQTIIVGVNDRDESLDALRLAADLARREESEVIVAAAFEPTRSDADYSEARNAFLATTSSRAAESLAGLDYRHVELRDAPARSLQHLAEDERADVVVLGSTHHGPLGSVLPGRTAERLLSGAPCAVAVAPRGYARGEHLGLGLIGVGYDGSAESDLALRAATFVAEHTDSELRVITVVPALSDGPFVASDRARREYRECLDRALALVPEEIEAEGRLEMGEAGPELARQGIDLDLLVVGSRGYGPVRHVLLGSTSTDVVSSAPCPVLVVPRGAETRGPGPATAKTADPVAS